MVDSMLLLLILSLRFALLYKVDSNIKLLKYILLFNQIGIKISLKVIPFFQQLYQKIQQDFEDFSTDFEFDSNLALFILLYYKIYISIKKFHFLRLPTKLNTNKKLIILKTYTYLKSLICLILIIELIQ